MGGVLAFIVGILVLAGIYGLLALVLNLVGGWAGMWDLGVAGLFGIGAYTYTLVTLSDADGEGLKLALGLPTLAGVLAAIAVTALAAFLIGIPTLRLRGEYFLITTFAFAEVIRQILINEAALTGGTVGINGLDRPLDHLVTGGNYRYILLATVVACLIALWWLTRRLGTSPYGRGLRAMRDNELLAVSVGTNITRTRMLTYILGGAAIGAIAPLYVWYIGRVVPDLFVSELTFTIWTALVVGGVGSFAGPVVGAFLLIGAVQLLQLIQVSAEHALLLSSMEPLIIGLALIAVLRLKPDGLCGERRAFARVAQLGRPPRARGPAAGEPPSGASVAVTEGGVGAQHPG